MKHLSSRWLICLTLVMIVASPAIVSAATLTTVYADSTRAVGTGTGTATDPIGVALPDFSPAINLLQNQTGTLIHLFQGGYCIYPTVTNGVLGAPSKCLPGRPPETGAPVATSLLWALGGAVGAVFLAAGFLLRRRGSA